MSNTKNKYVQKARQKALSGMGAAVPDTKHDIKKTLTYTGRDIVIGAIGGGLAGALAGRSSLLIGIVVTGAGHFFGSPSAAMFGVGMMASGGYQTVAGAMNGMEKEGMEGVKERFENFKQNIKKQLFLDKLIKSKKAGSQTTNGLGDVQYFNHAEESNMNGRKDLDFTEANRIESQLHASAQAFAKRNGMSGDFSGTDDEESESPNQGLYKDDDPSERLM